MKRFLIAMCFIGMWAGLIAGAQMSWINNESRYLIKKVERAGYQMHLYKYNDSGFFVLRYYTPAGKQIGLSYWRIDHKPLYGSVKVRHSLNRQLIKLDSSLAIFVK